tara:strand:- start:302 stop:883 length:582 start_codon:yes stop_codon:yes gene_type:complete
MFFKKKEFFLFIFLFLLQSCAGGRIGNFLERSFNDLEKTGQDQDLQKNLKNKKIEVKDNKDINNRNLEKTGQDQDLQKKLKNKKIEVKDNEDINNRNLEKIKKEEQKQKDVLENKKDKNLEKLQMQKKNKIKDSSKKRKIELQSYKIIFILKDVDPKDPTKDLSTILRNSEVNFEIEMIERILDSKKKIKKIN